MSGAIVVGYDGTDGARAALAEAQRLAGPLGAEVVCVFSRHVGSVGSEVEDLAEAVSEHGRAVLAEVGPGVRAEIADGRPSEALVKVAEAEEAQMIVVGSHGERPLRGVLLGSTPYRLLQDSPVPVLVVRATSAGA
jgi:nucleotide-binding universal stress UspA family protein